MTNRWSRLLAGILLSIALLAPTPPARAGRTAASFEALKEKAEKVDGLGTFLKSFVGVCKGDAFEQRDCRANTKTARKRFAGKLLHVRLSDRHGRLIRVARELPDGALRMAMTPFFDEAGYGLSKDRAPSFDKHGNPRAKLVPFTLTLPDSINRRSFELQLRSGNVSLELLFKVKTAWKVKRPGDEAAEGVAAQLKGLRLTSARTGEVLGEVTW